MGGATRRAELWAGPCERAGRGRACQPQPLRPPHALADPGPRTGTARRTPAAPGPSLEERGAAHRVRARAAGGHGASQPGAGRGECRHGGGGETPAGTCRSLCLRRAAPVAPPPPPFLPPRAKSLPHPLSWEEGVPSPSVRAPASQLRARDVGSRRGQTRVALAEQGHAPASSRGHTPGVLAPEVPSGPTSISPVCPDSSFLVLKKVMTEAGPGSWVTTSGCPFVGGCVGPGSNFSAAGAT